MVGKEIFNQIRSLGGMKVWSWGASAWKVFSEESFNKDINHLGGLLFKVRGHHHKGHVMVRLQGNDLYHVQFGYLRKGEFVLRNDMESVSDAYFDMLVDLIDERVERIAEYVR